MKRFSFIAGHRHDPSHGMVVGVDRSRVPASMHLRLNLDDDGSALPKIPRPATRAPGTDDGTITFVERATLRVKLGDVEGHLHVEAGTRFELTGCSRL